jgi:hypothetical protein
MLDIKKALAYIKENASETPKRTRTGNIIPVEIVNEIKEQIKKYEGSFAVDAKKFNTLFGWDTKYSKSCYLKNKLNDQYPLEKGKEWHVGAIDKGRLYKFEIREIEEKEE